MNIIIFLYALLFIWACLNVLAECPGSDWTGEKTLHAAKEFTLHYKVEGDVLVIRLRAKTTGFLGFGLSEAGHMIGSDIVTVAVVNDEARIEDRFAGWTSFSPNSIAPWNIPPPRKDSEQSWQSECASEAGGYTDVILSRPLRTVDCADREIINEEMSVIYAWGDDDTVAYHGANRGSTRLNFFEEPPIPFSPNGYTEIKEIFLNEYSLGSTATQYVLQLVDLGTDNVQHIVAMEPVILDEDKDFIQHMILHDCGDGETRPLVDTGVDLPINIPVDGAAFNGGLHLSPLGQSTCKNIIIAFGKNSGPIIFPPEAGVRLGSGGARWVILEIHIHNKGLEKNKDRPIASGIRIYSTESLRENDIGTLVLGNPDVNFNALAPGRVRLHREATCTEACTQQFGGPINLFYSFPRMHSFGKEIWTTLNEEVISSKEYYNTEFQRHIPLAVTLRPNDVLSTHCVFDTSQTTNPVYFGLSMANEMCMDLVLYWPKSNFNRLKCGWTADDRTICGDVRGLKDSNPIPDGTISTPLEVSVGGSTCTSFEIETSAPAPETTTSKAALRVLSGYSIALFWTMLGLLVLSH